MERQASVLVSSLEGSEHDERFVDRIFKYKGMTFLALPINGEYEVQKRSHNFIYTSVEKRILQDQALYEAELTNLLPIMYGKQLDDLPRDIQNERDPYWDNGFFSGADARAGYAVVATRKPSVIIEVGAGNSTKFFRKAITDYHLNTRITIIDPSPRADIESVSDRIVLQSALDTPLDVFGELKAGDILSWDGSHLCFNGSDALRLFLEVLPILEKGVIVHVHDICMPYEATYNWEVGDISYGEQYLMGVTLLANSNLKVVLPVYYLYRTGKIKESGHSFWLQT